MFWLTSIIVCALRISVVQAANETLHYGWQSEGDGRGTWSIIQSCLATIFICTWSGLHLKVPNYYNRGMLYLLLRKCCWMLVAAIAPDLILFFAADNFFKARDLSKFLAENGARAWTLTHTQFAFAGGFWNRNRTTTPTRCSPKQLGKLIEDGLVKPPISEEELASKGNSDSLVKLLAVLQSIWFVVQAIIRATQHWEITALEVMTCAFVFCSVFIYSFSWHLPQNVEIPVFVEPPTTQTRPKLSGVNWVSSFFSRGKKSRSGLKNQYTPAWAAETAPAILFGLSACGFGAIHCLAWNSQFPSAQEKLAWRVCAAASTALPALWGLGAMCGVSFLFVILITGPYVVARIAIIVLAFTSLRAVPPNAFNTIDWLKYLPHLSL